MKNENIGSIVIIFIIAAVILFSIILTLKWTKSKRAALDTPKASPEIILLGNHTIKITMYENPTTGYTWHYIIENDNVVQVISDEYIPPPDKKGILGAGGVHIWVLKAKSEGTTLITFNNYRGWEGVGKSVSTKVYGINVDKAGEISIKEG